MFSLLLKDLISDFYFTIFIWAAARQNQQYGRYAQRRRRSAWASVQSDQFSLRAQLVANDPMLLHADSEDSDQAGRMPRLIWVFAGHTVLFVGFVLLWRIWLAHSAKTIRLKKSSLMVTTLPFIMFSCYRVSAYYFAQAWTSCNYFVLQLDVLHPEALRTESTLFIEILFHRTRALK